MLEHCYGFNLKSHGCSVCPPLTSVNCWVCTAE